MEESPPDRSSTPSSLRQLLREVVSEKVESTDFQRLRQDLSEEAQRAAREATRDLSRIADEARRETSGPRPNLIAQLVGSSSLRDGLAQTARAALRAVRREVGPAMTDIANWVKREIGEAMPPNWRNLSIPELVCVRDLMSRTGWSLVWTPPGEVVKQIIDERDAEARRELLLAAEARVVEDLDRLVPTVARPELADLREATREALEAYRGGLFRSSQALSAALLSSALHEQLGFKSHTEAAKVFRETDPERAGFRQLRYEAVLLAVGKAIEPGYNPLTDRPQRSDFNRHATAHRVKEPQYRQVNALSALMLLVSLLIELDSLIAAEAKRAQMEREAREAHELGPQEEHFERVLRHGAGFVEEGDLSTAGTLYSVSLGSWLPDDDPRAEKAEALRVGWEKGGPVFRGDLDALRAEIEKLRDENPGSGGIKTRDNGTAQGAGEGSGDRRVRDLRRRRPVRYTN
jgi:hypothetical protein